MNPATTRPKPVLLAILDGWGHRDAHDHNAIASADTPVWHGLTQNYPNGFINASESHVGLPAEQMGNSEVGHMNIGSGRVLTQDLPRIDAAFEKREVAHIPAFRDTVAKIKGATNTCHLIGLLSPGGVHSHQSHMAAMAQLLAAEGITVNIHAILDGRDTPPKSAYEYLGAFAAALSPQLPSMVTLSGRYYAMDRDNRWDRVQKAYDTMVSGAGDHFATPGDAIATSYESGKTDEFILPCITNDYTGMSDGDGILFVNFRSDRMREIASALLDPAFTGLARAKTIKFSTALAMTQYSNDLAKLMPSLFAPQPLTHTFGEVVSQAGLKQLRIAETEKYAHVTFFFNGGRKLEFPGECRILVPSPSVATYDLKPEMSAPEITDKLVSAITAGTYDVIVVNYANTDMVGHTGNIAAAIKAVETVDTCLGRVVDAITAQGGAMIVTADHGNAEQMYDEGTHQPHTAHTINLVPVILIASELKGKTIPIPEGKLADIAPTLLQFLNLPQPAEMTGISLLPHA